MKLSLVLLLGVSLFAGTSAFSQQLTNSWKPLLTKDMKNFDVFIGVPHKSLTVLDGVPKGDGMVGTPLGLNNDPLHVFSVEMVDGQPVLHVSGQIFGGLSTKEVYGNYHLKVEFKWGEKKYEPKLKVKRDNGIIYHAAEPHGQFWNVWMRGHEFQVQEGDMGDYYALAGVGMDIHAKKKDTTKKSGWIYDPASPLQPFVSNRTPTNNCSHLAANYEKPNGEWNTLELICYGNKSIHLVNGHVVMVLENSRTSPKDGDETTLTKGKIQFQSEGAEAYYRNIQIRKIDKLPAL